MSHHTHDGKTVVITLPTGNTSNLVVTQNTTVGQIVDILVRMIPEGKDQGEEFGITLHESPEIIFERHTKIIKIPTVCFFSLIHSAFHLILVLIIVQLDRKNFYFEKQYFICKSRMNKEKQKHLVWILY